jgi:hypothetical protein
MNIFRWVCLFLVAMCLMSSCATITQTRINPDGSSYTAQGKVLVKGNISELKTTLSESVNEDGSYTLDIGQENTSMESDALELVELLRELLNRLPY